MIVEFLTNPWVIILIVLALVIGNILALKNTAKAKFGPSERTKQLDKLNRLYPPDKNSPHNHQEQKKTTGSVPTDKNE